jgi:peptide/nickel transport system substrate-binding protein
VFSNIYEQLITTDGSNMSRFVPWLATSLPDVSPDGLVYTFHLRQGITFQDGTLFNATAVKFNIDRDILINHADGPEYLIAAQETMAIKGGPRYFSANTVHVYNQSEVQVYLAANGVQVIDPYTVQITLEHPYAPALNQFAFTSAGVSFSSPSWIIQHCTGTALTPGVMPGFECEYTRTNPPPGTGPFQVVEITPKVQVVMQRYDNYWGGPGHAGPSKLKKNLVSLSLVITRPLST